MLVGSVSGGPASRFLNRGNVQGPSLLSNNWLTFNLLFKGSTGQTSGRFACWMVLPRAIALASTPNTAVQLGGSGTEFDIGGTIPGNMDDNYGQLNIVTDPSDLNDHGDLILSPGTSFNIVDWNGSWLRLARSLRSSLGADALGNSLSGCRSGVCVLRCPVRSAMEFQ